MMHQPPTLKISLSGVRGIVGESLTPQLVTSFAAAFGTYCGRGNIFIGTDTRPSREMVTQAAIAGLLSVGCTPVLLGIIPVPSLQYKVRKSRASGGICITASHNPTEWNALKFFGPDGIILRPNQFNELTDLYHQGVYPRVHSEEIQHAQEDQTSIVEHFAAVREAVDADLIRSKKFRIAIDCCNGAASLATPLFLKSLGCSVKEFNTDPSLPFPRNPEPTSGNLGKFRKFVSQANVDLGFAQDADADRLALLDSAGNPLGEDATVELAIRHYLHKNPSPVVVSSSASKIVEEIAEEAGCPIHRVRVGEINVIEKMQQVGSHIGGEGNGGVILLPVNPCRDSFVAMALILESMAQENLSLREIRAQLPTYHMVKAYVPRRPRNISRTLRLLRHFYSGLPMDLTDGLKISWPDKWLHVRGSNTEPIIRIVAEAKTREEAQALVDDVSEYLR
jgi:phosphomannomutase